MTSQSTVASAVLDAIAGTLPFQDALAQVVAYQRAWNPGLRKFWEARGFVATHPHPAEIPAVPTDAFRHARLVSTESPPSRVFRTSGTTSGARGEHWRLSTEAYDIGARLQFQRMVLADRAPLRFVYVLQPTAEVPDSSLSHMAADLARFSTEPVPWCVTDAGIATARLHAAIEASEAPVLLFGTAWALAAWLDDPDARPKLPLGSLVLHTGGFKGRTREIPRDDFVHLLADRCGVPLADVRTEYSMTELSSQLYTAPTSTAQVERLRPPPWCYVDAVDPMTLQPLADGEPGLLRFVDLANWDSVVAVQTADLGLRDGEDIVWIGRAQGAQLRGCGLAVEEILARLAQPAPPPGES